MSQSFLQSNGWEAFQKIAGHETFRFDETLVIINKLPAGQRYWYVPRPPKNFDIKQAARRAKKEGVLFVRIDPIEPLPHNLLYLTKRVIDVQPSRTILLDLSRSEDKLLDAMKPKTRYNVRLAYKKGVQVHLADAGEFDAFWSLLQQTTERDSFRGHGREYYEIMLATQSDDLQIQLYLATYEGAVLAGGIFAFHGKTATYVHGASSNEHREVMAPYSLHWEVMTLAKQHGFLHYDLFGISEKKWPGVTRFKRGFGGREIVYPGTYDIILYRNKYCVYQWLRKVRRLLG